MTDQSLRRVDELLTELVEQVETARALPMMSRWPFVTGSKDPGHMARRTRFSAVMTVGDRTKAHPRHTALM